MDELSLNLLFTIIAILILLSAFFSSAETGMMSLNRYRLKHLLKQRHKGARRAYKLLRKPDQLISLILIGNNLVNFITASLFTVVAIRLWGEDAAVVAAPVILTMVVLIFAEITPKTIAALHPEKIAFPAANILTALLKILFPVVWLINSLTNGILKLLGIDPSIGSNEDLSSDELRTIVGEAGPHIPKRHQGMLINILDLEDINVEDIMIPRNEVVGIDLQESDEDILATLRDTEFTRIPVYDDDINNILGVLHQRYVSRIIDNEGLNRSQLTKEMVEPYFVPESTPLHTQLVNFQKHKHRMGMVVDEYGVVQGLVTLEDILEEIVGEFTSNFADNTEDIHTQDNGTHHINGTTTIRDINKNLDWELPTEGPKTLNGLLLEHLESFPDAAVCVQFDEYLFEIIEVKDNMIQNVKAHRLDSPSEPHH
ncbi:HlyC/CorC family transporter [Dasania sp. GY-MA-18]|uniref:HlyC/CorC family transporter n=1 Tax=Dasania phycosphaerae TaxID=2950436 RepID=A0A9J6RMC5_9GAMM|nr:MULTISPECIES: HlyC/CorC family transporter [Dasania]MCR8922703.1 HlyC/CorC family transporter [Dasania sp. GY-MA-18]MCZ0865133.1 HlyC/CorC family transporter [Dasania phycosphaerae]MCZ0868859.1 HlyC/CorC family transporter [Dasania phycosphaerae]